MKKLNQLEKMANIINALLDEKNLALTYLIASAPDCKASTTQLAQAIGVTATDTKGRLSWLVNKGILSNHKQDPACYTISYNSFEQVIELLDMAGMDHVVEPYFKKLLGQVEVC